MKTVISVQLSAERLAEVDALAKRLGKTRSEAIDMALRLLPDRLSARPNSGPFGIVAIKLGPYGEMVSREWLPETYQSRQEASERAAELAAMHEGAHGQNEEHGYWWGRTSDHKITRFVVEARPHT